MSDGYKVGIVGLICFTVLVLAMAMVGNSVTQETVQHNTRQEQSCVQAGSSWINNNCYGKYGADHGR